MAVHTGSFEGRAAFIDALRAVLLQAFDTAGGGARELHCLDVNFAPWPLSDPALLDALTPWARMPGRRLHLLALHYDDLRRLHPRFVRWRVLFDHCVEARSYEPEAANRCSLASALLVSGSETPLCLRLFDTQHWRGTVTDLPADALRTREIYDALTQRSEPSFSATTFGL